MDAREREALKRQGEQSNKLPQWAVVPLILIVWLVIVIVLSGPFFPYEAPMRAKVARVRADQRTIALALEDYCRDHPKEHAYPAWSLDPAKNAFGGLRDKRGIFKKLPTFTLPGGVARATLTTPIAYIPSYSLDPFAPIKGMTYCYWSPGVEASTLATHDGATTTGRGGRVILWSPGPDGVYDLTSENIAQACDPTKRMPSDTLVERTYDPSNGTGSRGDVYWYKQ